MDAKGLKNIRDMVSGMSRDLGLIRDRLDKELSESTPDPLAEWKALEPGRKVLYPKEKEIYTYMGIEDDQMVFDNENGVWEVDITEKELSKWQIIPEGPFDGSKLKVGDWVWVESKHSDVVHGWQQLVKEHSTEKGRWKVADTDGGLWIFEQDGSSIGLSGSTIHYYPPSLDAPKESEEQRFDRVCHELAKDKAFVAHAIKVVSGARTGNDTCPCNSYLGGLCNCGVDTGPREDTPCYKLYHQIRHCPCYESGIGLDRVKSDLSKIIAIAAGV